VLGLHVPQPAEAAIGYDPSSVALLYGTVPHPISPPASELQGAMPTTAL